MPNGIGADVTKQLSNLAADLSGNGTELINEKLKYLIDLVELNLKSNGVKLNGTPIVMPYSIPKDWRRSRIEEISS